MIPLKSLLVEIPEKLVTYHRSLKTFKPGDVLSAQKMGSEGRHHYQEAWFENPTISKDEAIAIARKVVSL